MSKNYNPKVILALARQEAIRIRPYFAKPLWVLSLVEANHGTMSITENFVLFWDPKAVEKWGVHQSAAVLLHEIEHPLRRHFKRAQRCMKGIDGEITPHDKLCWSFASDFEINDDLINENVCLPDPLLPHHQNLPDGESAEFYFEKLKEELPEETSKIVCMCGSGATGMPEEWEKEVGDLGLDPDEVENIIESTALEVVKEVKSRPGRVPAKIKRWAEEEVGVVHWAELLSQSIRESVRKVRGRCNYTYKKPNRRSLAGLTPVILPSLTGVSPKVAGIVDTSASMTKEMISQALAEMTKITRESSGECWLIQCDVVAREPIKVPPVPNMIIGGGGTDMGAGLKKAEEKVRPDIAVVLTDGGTPWPKEKPNIPHIIVGLVGRFKRWTPDWAKIVEIKRD